MLSARASVDAASRLREPMDAFATREDRMRHRTRRRVRVAAGGRVVAQLLRRLRQMPDRLLHPRRRRAALESLIARQPPARVLVVCNGNIFRSPFAAAVLRRVAGPRRSEEHTSELQSQSNLVCRLLLETKKRQR